MTTRADAVRIAADAARQHQAVTTVNTYVTCKCRERWTAHHQAEAVVQALEAQGLAIAAPATNINGKVIGWVPLTDQETHK